MKRKAFLICLMLALVICAFTIVASAATPSRYIEFKVKLGSIENDYVTVYTENQTGTTPKLNLSLDIFQDVEFTQPIEKNEIVAIDMSGAVETNTANGQTSTKISYFATSSTPLSKCEEIKWFTTSGSSKTVSTTMFENWTALKRFDFGCVTEIADKGFKNSGLVDIVIPSTITKIKSAAFSGCLSLKTVKFEGSLETLSGSTFYGCTALESVDLGQLTSICDSMFYNCSSLKAVVLPSTVKSIAKEPFRNCTSLKSVDLGQITSMNYNAFSGCTSLVDIKFSTAELSINGKEAFSGCTSLKYVKIPNTVVSINYGMFSGCTALEFVELSNATGNVPDKMFSGCTALKAVSIPEGIVGIEENAFKGCSALKAVYLPTTLTTIGDNAEWGRGAFDSCKNLYFVNDPFEVRDENGDWYGDNFVMPQEPEVYYMPSGLTTIFGVEFLSCEQLNRYIVFPTTFTEISAANGPFGNVGLNNKKGGVTLVFLGKMTKVCYGTVNKRANNISFVFAHKENTGIDTIPTWHIEQTSKPVNFYAYFCAGNVVYDLASFNAPSDSYDAKETDFAKTTYTEETYTHIANPDKTIASEPDCVTNVFHTKYCFCGDSAGTTEVENTALGHNHDLENGAVLVGIIYEDYTADGYKVVKCSRCDENDNTQVASKIILEETGFSAKINGNGITFGYSIDNVALAELKSVYAGAQIGFVTAVKSYLGTNNPLDENANEVALEKGKVLKADVTNEIIENNITRIDFKLVGDIWNNKVDLDGNAENGAEVAIKDISFVMSAYIYANDMVSYINANDGAPQEVIYSTLTE